MTGENPEIGGTPPEEALELPAETLKQLARLGFTEKDIKGNRILDAHAGQPIFEEPDNLYGATGIAGYNPDDPLFESDMLPGGNASVDLVLVNDEKLFGGNPDWDTDLYREILRVIRDQTGEGRIANPFRNRQEDPETAFSDLEHFLATDRLLNVDLGIRATAELGMPPEDSEIKEPYLILRRNSV